MKVNTSTRKRLYTLLGVAVSAILVWMLFRDIDFRELTLALRQANYWWLIPNILMIVLTMYQRAYRWKFMVQPIKQVPFAKLLAATCIGFMANNVLPLRLGEFVRAYSLSSQDREITRSASLATIFGERMVFDLVALLLIFGAVLFASNLNIDDEMMVGLNLAIAIALTGIVFMLILALKPQHVGRMMTRYLFFVPDRGKVIVESTVIKFSRGLEFLTDGRAVISVSIQTILIWVLMGISNVFVFMAFDLGLPLDASFVVLVVVSVSILVPSTPGFLGVYHAAVVWSLTKAYGIEPEAALSCALVLHAAQYIVVTLMGFYFLKKAHLSLKKLEQAAEQEDGA